MSLWNSINLQPPPIATYKTKSQNVDIIKLEGICKEALKGFKNHRINLDPEAAYIYRWIYRMKNKFRSDQGLKCIEKMNRALLQLVRINFIQTLKTFHDMVPSSYSHDTYLPTLNNLHFVLVRIQGAAKLMMRIIELSRTAGEFFQDRIVRGHFWNVSLICLASIARIHKICKEYTKKLCKLYNQLLPFTHALKNIKFNWLPNDYDLPSDLKIWLNADELLNDVKKLKPRVMVPAIFDISSAEIDIELNAVITEQSTSAKPEQDRLPVKKKNLGQDVTRKNPLKVISVSDEDIGEVIETKPVAKRLKQKQTLNSIKVINKIETLKDLIKFQNDLQQNNLKCFENVDKLQCRILHNKLKKFIKKGGKNSNNLKNLLEEAREIIKSLLL